MNASPFRPRTVLILVLTAGTSLLAFFSLLAFGDELKPFTSAHSDTFSRSALGHRAFVEMLRRMNVPVVVSREGTARKLEPSSVLLMAEPPEVDDESSTYAVLRDMMKSACRALIVLPKRVVVTEMRDGTWAQRVRLHTTDHVDEILEELRIGGRVARPETVLWTGNALGFEPVLTDPQVLADSKLIPLVTSREGILLGEIRDTDGRILVLSDPDILATHGLGEGDNANLAYRIIESLRDGEGTVVIDETQHGFTITRSLWAELFRFPLVLVMLHLAATSSLLLWAALERFGGVAESAPEIQPGVNALILNTAELLQRGRHAPRTLERYFRATLRTVADTLHAPRDLVEGDLGRWLGSVGERRGVSTSIESLSDEVRTAARGRRWETGRVTATARRIHRWKTEILHGTADRRS